MNRIAHQEHTQELKCEWRKGVLLFICWIVISCNFISGHTSDKFVAHTQFPCYVFRWIPNQTYEITYGQKHISDELRPLFNYCSIYFFPPVLTLLRYSWHGTKGTPRFVGLKKIIKNRLNTHSSIDFGMHILYIVRLFISRGESWICIAWPACLIAYYCVHVAALFKLY